jgi:DNA-directed RNA polymerase specialized sigma24 family protein
MGVKRRSLKVNVWQEWIRRARTELAVGEAFFIPVENKNHQRLTMKALENELKILSIIDPIESNKIQIYDRVMDSRMWVILLRVASNPTMGFKRNTVGTFEKVSLKLESDKSRMVRLMLDDDYTVEQIAEHMGISEAKVHKLLTKTGG